MLQRPTLLLTTNLHRPSADPNWVARPELLAHLQRGLTHKLILLSAPPGFGKTTLVSQWLVSGSTPVAWVVLDGGDNQLIQFLRYLIAAVHTCVPAACPTTQRLLAATALPPADYLVDSLLSELTALTSELVLVLDDYHLIRASEVHQILRHLLRYLPPQLHLVILTRIDPPLNLGRWRIEQQVLELRASDLRFAPTETRRFLQHRVSQPLDDEVLQTLHTRTEGWITGLQLASISLQSQDARQFLAHFRGNDRLIGHVADQPARLGVLVQIYSLGFLILSVACLAEGDAVRGFRQLYDFLVNYICKILCYMSLFWSFLWK